MRKKIFALLVAFFATCFVCVYLATSVNAEGVDWAFDEQTGTLTFSGQGGMNYGENPEWHRYSDSVTSIVIEEGVTSVSGFAFRGFSRVTSVSIPNSLQSIGRYAFTGCSSLISFPLTDNITKIGDSAFSGCAGVKEFVVPPKVTTICDGTFSGCTGLEKVVFHSNVSRIERNAFANCIRLTEVEIPNSVVELGSAAFMGCTGLKKVSLSNKMKEISSVFNYCTSLTEITIPNSVVTIGSSTFANCQNLARVNIGSGVSEINATAFDHCPNLKELSVSQANPNFCSVQGVIYSKDKTKLIEIPEGYLGAYSVLSGTTVIAEYAGHQCEKLTSLVIPDSVKTIEKYGFADCKTLTSVSLSEGLSEIAGSAFRFCISLEQIVFPSTLTKLGSAAFGHCTKLTHITFTGKVPAMSYSAFESVTGDAYYPGEDPTWIEWHEEHDAWVGDKVIWKPVYCTGNHKEVVAKETAATCTTDGLTAESRCSVCGKPFSEQKKIPATGHRFGQWTQIKAATANATGLEKRSCSACGTEEQKVLPKLTNQGSAKVEEPVGSMPSESTKPALENFATEPTPSEEENKVTEEATVASTEPSIDPSDDTPEQPKAFPWVAVVIGAAVLLAGGGAGIWLWIRRKS